MKPLITLTLLLLSALLEVGGDAFMRFGQREPRMLQRIGLLLLGSLALTVYGYLVNASQWDFGRLLGLYVVVFFVVAQVVAWVALHQRPGLGVLLGGSFIVTGGVIITLAGGR